jgi:predicted metal-dependent enzyme (double-stranded beta helix superfamily)
MASITLKMIGKMLINIEDRIKRDKASMEIKFDRLNTKLSMLETLLMARIDDVIAAVAEETSVIASVGVLLDKLTADIADLREDLVEAEGDTAKVDELLDAVEANKDLLRAAVIRNTPAEGEEPVDEHGLTM